jgi:hypothetical protein
LSPIAAILKKMDGQLSALRDEVDGLKASVSQEAAQRGGPQGVDLSGLEKLLRDSLEGQDKLLLSVIEAVRDAKKSNAEAQEKVEQGLRQLLDRLRDDGGKKRWF